MSREHRQSDDDFVEPGVVQVSPAALSLARDFASVVGKKNGKAHIVTFDWAESVSVTEAPGERPKQVGPCLMLGAYERHQVPVGLTHSIDGFEFAVRIPKAQLSSDGFMIDFDPGLLFKLVLRPLSP